MWEQLLKRIAVNQKYQLGLLVVITFQLIVAGALIFGTGRFSESVSNIAQALLVRTVTMIPGDTGQALCPNGVTSVIESADKKKIEVFCN